MVPLASRISCCRNMIGVLNSVFIYGKTPVSVTTVTRIPGRQLESIIAIDIAEHYSLICAMRVKVCLLYP